MSTPKRELVAAIRALHERVAREHERASHAARTQVIGGWAQVGAALDELLRAAFVAACAERSLDASAEFRRRSGRDGFRLSLATAGQSVRTLALLAREQPPRDPTLQQIADEAASETSPLRRAIDQRNAMVHNRRDTKPDALADLHASVTRWWLPFAGTESLAAKKHEGRSAAQGAVIADRYTLDTLLGEGTFGEVWSAQDRRLAGRLVAVKILKAEMASHAEAIERFDAEADALAGLAHPNVVTVLDRGAYGLLRYLVTEYIEGPTLAAWITAHRDEGTTPTPAAVARLMDAMCAGVEAAHAVRQPGAIVHRDMKPDNVLLQALPDGSHQVKVVDFGIARLTGRERTAVGARLGTPLYMAPEQAHDSSRIGPWTDVFALAVIAVELLTLRPFVAEQQPWWWSVSQPGFDPRAHLAGVPAQVVEALLVALQAEPSARFQDARAFRRALARAFSSEPATSSVPPAVAASSPSPTVLMSPTPAMLASTPPVAVTVPPPRPSRSPRWPWLAGAAAVAAAALFALRPDARETSPSRAVRRATAAPPDGRCVFAARGDFHLRALPWINSIGAPFSHGTSTELLAPLDVRRGNSRLYQVRVAGSELGMAFVDPIDLVACGQPFSLAGTVTLARPNAVFASSEQSTHAARHAFDQDVRSAWNAAEGRGEGEWVEARYDVPRNIHRVVLATGWDWTHARDGDLFPQNDHLARVTVTFDDGNPITREVAPDTRMISFEDLAVTASRVRITADRVWPGTRWADLTISEVEVHAE